MKKQNIIVRTLKNRARRNEEIWTTKKAEKALLQIAGTLAFMLIVNSLINIALAQTNIINIDNSLNSGVRLELESERNVPQDKRKDDTLVQETIEEKIAKTFPGSVIAVAVAKSESGLNPKSHSNVDITKDGHVFSIGLFQINITVHEVGDKDCKKAFKGTSRNAIVVDEDLYQECVQLAENPDVNLAVARSIYENSKNTFNPWGGYTSNGFIKFLN